VGGLLSVIAARAAAGQTGAAWQRATLAAAEQDAGRDRGLAVMLGHYLTLAGTQQPVHTWPVPGVTGSGRSRPGGTGHPPPPRAAAAGKRISVSGRQASGRGDSL
jgi:hypothetical protein